MASASHGSRQDTTGALAVFELRRHLVRQSVSLSARARGLHVSGERAAALQLVQKSRELRWAARVMGNNECEDTT